MARPLKQGIEYFSLDVDFFSDVKTRRLLRACGPASISILISLLCCIYRDRGYYVVWDKDLPFLVADMIGTTEGAVEEVIRKALQVGFFRKDLYEKYKILTSEGIQKRFKSAVTRRGEIEYVPDYWISDCNNEVFACNNPVSDDRNAQSKVKRKKSNPISLPSFEVGEGENSPKTVKPVGTGLLPFETESEAGTPLVVKVVKVTSSGAGRGKTVTPVSKARELFEARFREIFSEEYYWTAKDASAMKQLLGKLEFQRRQKEMPTDESSLLYAFQVFLSSIRERWICENFSLSVINSKFNEIISQARNGKNNSTSRTAYPSTAERIREESARHIQGIAARLGSGAALPDGGEPDVF